MADRKASGTRHGPFSPLADYGAITKSAKTSIANSAAAASSSVNHDSPLPHHNQYYPKRRREVFPWLPRLQHGVVRPSNDASSRNSTTVNHVLVPAGYASMSGRHISVVTILHALGLPPSPPPLLMAIFTAPQSTFADVVGAAAAASEFQEYRLELLSYAAKVGAWIVERNSSSCSDLSTDTLCPTATTFGKDKGTVDDGTAPVVSLGLVTLEQRRQETDIPLRNDVYSNMVRVERSASAAPPSSKDTASLSSLPFQSRHSHVIVFEQAADEALFYEQLTAQIPTILLALPERGSPLSAWAASHLYATLRDPHDDSPMVVFRGGTTAKAIDSSSLSEPHVKATNTTKEGNVVVMDLCDDLLRQCHGRLDESTTTATLSINADRLVIVDPVQTKPRDVQSMIHSVVNDAFGPPQTSNPKVEALEQANALLQRLQTHADRNHFMTILQHVQLWIWTLLATVASVMYAHIYVGQPSLQDPVQCLVFASTILVPFVVTELEQRIVAANSPGHMGGTKVAWSSLQVVACCIEAEIVYFRASVGPWYRVNAPGTSSSAVAASDQEDKPLTDPDLVFLQRIHALYATVEGTPIPVDSSSDVVTPSTTIEGDDAAMPLLVPTVQKSQSSAPGVEFSKPIDWKKRRFSPMTTIGTESAVDTSNLVHGSTVWNRRTMNFTTIRDYQQQRLNPFIAQCRRHQAFWSQRRYMVHTVLLPTLTLSTSVLAALSMQWVIPMVLALMAVVSTASDSLCDDAGKLQRASFTITALDATLQWWTTLSVEEQMQRSNQERFVGQSESAILQQVVANFPLATSSAMAAAKALQAAPSLVV